MHIPPFDNRNDPIVAANDDTVPLNYFNIVKLKAGETYGYAVDGYETCVVPATGTVTVETMGETFADIGNRGQDVWDGDPEGVYVPSGAGARITARTDTETFVAGAKFADQLKPFFLDKVLEARRKHRLLHRVGGPAQIVDPRRIAHRHGQRRGPLRLGRRLARVERDIHRQTHLAPVHGKQPQ